MKVGSRAATESGFIILSAVVMGLLLAVFSEGTSSIAGLPPEHMAVVFCLAGSVFYCVLKFRTVREMILSIFIVTLAHLFLFRVTAPRYFLELFLYYAALGASIAAYRYLAASRLKSVRIGKFVLMAVIIVAVYSAATAFVSLFLKGRSLSQSLTAILSVYSLAGAALGLGLEAGELAAGNLLKTGEKI
jgi:hypothetical protein